MILVRFRWGLINNALITFNGGFRSHTSEDSNGQLVVLLSVIHPILPTPPTNKNTLYFPNITPKGKLENQVYELYFCRIDFTSLIGIASIPSLLPPYKKNPFEDDETRFSLRK